ncbi:MAG: hypothetical protein KY442_03505, partial [Proteobacteria bacterium]|nr:hypothetical protein [Pseudomonadota bacterium]
AAPQGVAEQIAQRMRAADRYWFGIAPEGTRKPVQRWKTGFWKIARAAGVPVLPAYFHYPDRVIGIGPLFVPSDDMQADLARLRAWYRPWQGKHHGTKPSAREPRDGGAAEAQSMLGMWLAWSLLNASSATLRSSARCAPRT